MNYIKQFLKTSGVFFIGNTLTKLISFFLLPLYTIKIDPESLGYYDLSISLINLLIPIIFLQVWDSIFRFTFDYEKNSEKYIVISNGVTIQFISLIIYIIFFIIITNIINYTISYKYLIFIYGILMAFQYYYNCVARSFSKNTLLVTTGLLNSIISISINVICIIFLNMGIEAMYLSYITGTIIQILILETKLNILNNFNINSISIELIKRLVLFALPLCVITLSYWLLNGLTMLTVSNRLGMFENGLYGVTNRLSSIVILVVNVFQFAWYEMSYSMVKDNNKKEYYTKALNFILKVVLYVGSLSLILIKVIFPYMISEQYSSALLIIPFTFIGVIINAYASFASTLFLAEKDSKELVLPIIASAFANIIGLILLTDRLGLIGATSALSISFLVNAILITNKLKKEYSICLEKNALSGGLVTLLFSVMMFYIIDETNWLIIIAILLLAVLIIIFRDIFKTLLSILKR